MDYTFLPSLQCFFPYSLISTPHYYFFLRKNLGIIYMLEGQRSGRVDVFGDRGTRMPGTLGSGPKPLQAWELLSLSLPTSLEDLGKCYLLSENRESLEP
jgi:hypothetical protein